MMYESSDIFKLIKLSGYHKGIDISSIYSKYVKVVTRTYSDLQSTADVEEYIILRSSLSEKHKLSKIITIFSVDEVFDMLPEFLYLGDSRIVNKNESLQQIFKELGESNKREPKLREVIDSLLFNLMDPVYEKWMWNLTFN